MLGLDRALAGRRLRMWGPRRAYHRAVLAGAHRLPATSGALLVSNHGRLDFDSFILCLLVLRSNGRLVRLLGDRLWFGLPVASGLMASAGVVEGTRENARRLLEGGELVLTYPGGVPEILSSRYGREHVDWRGRTGFARVALDAGVPIIPVVSVGVNNGHLFLTSGCRLGRLLYRRILRLGPEYDSYRDPLTVGLLPLPLPFSTAVHLPLPCKVRYVVGEPIYPVVAAQGVGAGDRAPVGAGEHAPVGAGDRAPAGEPTGADALAAERELAERVIRAMRELIRQHGRLGP
ncbi:MAG: acyltransferase family protein [Thermoleophilia bacterium]|nr:acyltransferase family protein [Thermoleophilia bacterium]